MQKKIARAKLEATAEVADQLGPKEKEAIKANDRMTSELWWQVPELDRKSICRLNHLFSPSNPQCAPIVLMDCLYSIT
jgi:hypothetical protein